MGLFKRKGKPIDGKKIKTSLPIKKIKKKKK